MPESVAVVEIYEVRYPDERRREEGFSTVLFRDRTVAERFAKRHEVTVRIRTVTSLEFRRLRDEGYFEGGC